LQGQISCRKLVKHLFAPVLESVSKHLVELAFERLVDEGDSNSAAIASRAWVGRGAIPGVGTLFSNFL